MVCDLCQSTAFKPGYRLSGKYAVTECLGCGLRFLSPMPGEDELRRIYKEGYFCAWGRGACNDTSSKLKELLYARIFNEVEKHIRPGRALDVGCAFGDSLKVAQGRGWEAFGVEISDEACRDGQTEHPGRIYHGDFAAVELPKGYFDLVIMSDFLEHSYNLINNTRKAYDILRRGGLLAVLVPDINSLSAKLMQKSWVHFKEEHLYYLSVKTLRLLLEKSGFHPLLFKPFYKPINISYLANHARYYGAKYQYAILRFLEAIMPHKLRSLNINVPQGEIFSLAEKK